MGNEMIKDKFAHYSVKELAWACGCIDVSDD